MIGLSTEDADARGVGEFTTELALVEDGPSRPVADDDPESGGRPVGRGRAGPARHVPSAGGPQLPVSLPPSAGPARAKAGRSDFNKNFSLE
jgi:hypothetical protein